MRQSVLHSIRLSAGIANPLLNTITSVSFHFMRMNLYMMTLELAERVQRIKPSPTIAVSARADELIAAGKNIINLSLGEPDFDTPDHIKEAAIKAIRDGFTKYTAVDGILELKHAIVNKFLHENKLSYTPSHILVSCGAKHSVFNAFSAILNPGDEIIIPAPFWVSYPDIAKLMDATPISIFADESQHFKITPTQLKTAITPKTRMVLINSPSNPTGMAYTANELKALASILLSHPHIIIVTDDIYEHTIWSQEPFCNILNVCPELHDRCIVINGVSKTYAMTGWRIGYAAGPAHLIAAMKKMQSQSTSNPSSISQVAALAALTGDQSCRSQMRDAYQKRHDFMVKELNTMPGLHCLQGDGTFYAFPSAKKIIQTAGMKNDIEFADYLLNKAEVAIIPGSAFGAPDYFRLSYATSMEKLEEAARRMHNALLKLSP